MIGIPQSRLVSSIPGRVLRNELNGSLVFAKMSKLVMFSLPRNIDVDIARGDRIEVTVVRDKTA